MASIIPPRVPVLPIPAEQWIIMFFSSEISLIHSSIKNSNGFILPSAGFFKSDHPVHFDYLNDYMQMSQNLHTIRSINVESSLHEICIDLLFQRIGDLQRGLWEWHSLGLVGPVLLGLMSSLGVKKGAQHDNQGNILVVDSFPEVIKLGDRGLSKSSKHFSINQRSHFIGINIKIVDLWNLHPTMFIYNKIKPYKQKCHNICSSSAAWCRIQHCHNPLPSTTKPMKSKQYHILLLNLLSLHSLQLGKGLQL